MVQLVEKQTLFSLEDLASLEALGSGDTSDIKTFKLKKNLVKQFC